MKTSSPDQGVSLSTIRLCVLLLWEREDVQEKPFLISLSPMVLSLGSSFLCIYLFLLKLLLSFIVSGIIIVHFSFHGPASVGGLISPGFSHSLV